MEVVSTELSDVKLIVEKMHRDSRGFFIERFQQESWKNAGLPHQFVQDNHSLSYPRVLRGLHMQPSPMQGKLISVIRGRIWDVAVDLRPTSPDFGQHVAVELSGSEGVMLWVPPGFAHGFCVLGDEPASVFYKVTAAYAPSVEIGIAWNDPDLDIKWPLKNPLLSERDKSHMSFAEYRAQTDTAR